MKQPLPKIVRALKDFNITDDQILEITIEPKITVAARKLQELLENKWNIPTLDALAIVKQLKQQL